MASDKNVKVVPPDIYTLTLNETRHRVGGLVQAHISGNTGTIKLDGRRRADGTCQFYCHQLTDTSSGSPQSVVRFESVAHSQFNLHWNVSYEVCLQDCSGTKVDPGSNRYVWWIQAGPKTKALLKPYQFPKKSQYYLAFEDDKSKDHTSNPATDGSLNDDAANLTACLSCAKENGQLDIQPYNSETVSRRSCCC